MLSISTQATSGAGRIDGTIFADTNENALWDAGDGRNAGWTVYLDANNNAALNIGETRQTTDANGTFSFPNLTPGNYIVREVLQSGWRRTVPTGNDFLQVGVPIAGVAQASFGNAPLSGTLGKIAGTLWADLNDDGIWGTGDGRNVGWTAYVDANNNSTLDGNERTAVTDINGNYSIDNLLPGTYIVRELLQAGWRRRVPVSSDNWTLTVAGGQTASAPFGNAPLAGTLAKVTGTLWADVNNSGAWDAGDQRNVGWRVYVDANNNSTYDTGEASGLTDLNGNYTINNLIPGTHIVREVIAVGWRRISPGQNRYILNLTNGQTGSATFGNSLIPPNVGTLQGTVWSDLNDNAILDGPDGRLTGWKIFLDTNNNGSFDGGERNAFSDENGGYVFEYLPIGNYIVRQEIQSGWRRVVPVTSDHWNVTVGLNQVVTTSFGNTEIPAGAQITGNLFVDENANNSWDNGDGRCVGWQVYVDANNNSTYDVGEFTAVTDYNGFFMVAGLPAGTHKLRQVLLPGWRQSIPRNIDHHLLTVAAGGTAFVTFGNTQAVSVISGRVFNDANGNGVRDAGEAPLANWAVYVDSNNNDYDDHGERWTTTNANGDYAFTGLLGGSYRVRMIERYGWTRTLNAGSSVALVNGTSTITGVGFAAFQNPEPSEYAANRFIAWNNIGSSSSIVADRGVGWNIKAQGWTGFINTYLNPQLNWGAQRVLLHNPFGTAPGEGVFQADQAISAQQAGLTWLFNDFVSAWQPVIASGVEVIAYLGFMKNDDSFTGLDDTAWWARFWQSMDYPIRAGMNFAFDMSLDCGPGDREWAAIEALRALGRKVYGEPRPPEHATHWRASPLIAEDHIWIAADPERFPEELGWAAKDSQISGEVVRFVNRAPAGIWEGDYRAWIIPGVKIVLRQGHSAAVELNNFLMASVNINDLLRPIAARVNPSAAIEPAPRRFAGLWSADSLQVEDKRSVLA